MPPSSLGSGGLESLIFYLYASAGGWFSWRFQLSGICKVYGKNDPYNIVLQMHVLQNFLESWEAGAPSIAFSSKSGLLPITPCVVLYRRFQLL